MVDYSYYGGHNHSSDSGGVFGCIVFLILIGGSIFGFFYNVFNSSPSSSSDDYPYEDSTSYDYSYDSYSDYDDRDSYDDYDDYDYDYTSYEEPSVETWDCYDTTSYDKNPYNDNYCTSSTGRAVYATDSYAESLDPAYTAGTAGHPYYNSF